MHIFREAHTRAARSPGRERRETERAQNASARAGPGGTTNTTNRPSLHGQRVGTDRERHNGAKVQRERKTERDSEGGSERERGGGEAGEGRDGGERGLFEAGPSSHKSRANKHGRRVTCSEAAAATRGACCEGKRI